MNQNRSTGNRANDSSSNPSQQPSRPSVNQQRPSLRQQMRTGAPHVRARADQARAQRQARTQGPTANPARGQAAPARNRTHRAPAARPAQQTAVRLPQWAPIALAVALVALVAFLAFGRVGADQNPAHDNAAAPTSSSQATDGQQPIAQVPTLAASEGVLDYATQMVAYRATNGPVGDWSVSFASTGDILFGRQVGDYIDMYGGAAPLERVADQLAAPDVTIGNLEAPLSSNESEAMWEKDVILIGRPEGIESLKASDFTFVSLANNHSMDYGASALADTMALLDEAGIKHAGAGMNYDEAWQMAETTVDGVRIAFLSFTDVIPENFLAYETSAGVAAARIDMDETCKAVREAAKSHDIVVVAMHWGIEYEDYITEWMQSEPAHQIVDAGADVILGNHPHVIQGIEFYKGALISYSQGDFVFDHFSTRKTGETFILDFDVTAQGIQNVRATPIYLEDPYGIPYVLEGQEATEILDRLQLISEGMNTTFDMHDDIATITPTDGVNKHQR